jgi:SAM-dependent methyltransferase
LVDARYGEAHPEYLELSANEEQLRAFVLSLPGGYPPTAEQAPVVEYAIDRLRLTGAETVLDIGAGMCWTTAALAAMGCRAVAVDLSELFMPRSRFFCEDGRYFDRIFGDMASIPVASGSFDVVFANAAIHHSPDLRRTITELSRVLRRGGRLVFTNEPVAGPRERKRLARFGAEAIEEGFNENIYTTAEWAAAFAPAGLEVRFEIASAGIAEKVKTRRNDPHNSLFRKTGLFVLSRAWVRAVLLPVVKPFALRLYPFNVVIWAEKPE